MVRVSCSEFERDWYGLTSLYWQNCKASAVPTSHITHAGLLNFAGWSSQHSCFNHTGFEPSDCMCERSLEVQERNCSVNLWWIWLHKHTPGANKLLTSSQQFCWDSCCSRSDFGVSTLAASLILVVIFCVLLLWLVILLIICYTIVCPDSKHQKIPSMPSTAFTCSGWTSSVCYCLLLCAFFHSAYLAFTYQVLERQAIGTASLDMSRFCLFEAHSNHFSTDAQ